MNPILIRRDIVGPDGNPTGGHVYYHWCPGCDEAHGIHVGARNHSGASWSFDGDMERPTFSPSVRCSSAGRTACHYFVKGGMIEFCGDSLHTLAGKTVNLPPVPDWLAQEDGT